MKKKLFLALTASAIFFGGLSANAVLLPHPMQVYIYTYETGSTVRFDGLINLPDGTMYIPVIPAEPIEVEKLKIVYTYPAGKTLKDRPDIITFNNNYSLLKVLKDGRKRTVTNYENLPDVIKTGAIPQDMLVPTGFYVHENMRGLLGNLEIPVVKTSMDKKVIASIPKEPTDMSVSPVKTETKNGKKVVKTYKKTVKAVLPKELSDKMFLVTNFDSQYLKVFSPGRPEPIYGLKLKGILKDVKVTPDKKYLITAIFGKNQVDVADIQNEQIARSIELNMQPSEIVIDENSQKAYVLSTEGHSIFAINLRDMTITEKITLNAVPYRMTISPDGTQIAYADKNSDMIYIIKLDDDYKNVPVTKCENISKIVLDDANRLYVLSRTNNTVTVNDYNLNKPYVTGEEDEPKGAILQKKLAYNTRKMLGVATVIPENAELGQNEEIEAVTATELEQKIKTGNKPTEMFLYKNKLFIVCSGESVIDILDTTSLKYTGKITLPFKGFPRKITRIENSNLALVTDAEAKKYAVLNLDTNKIQNTYPIDTPVNSITIVKKINNINLIEQTL